MSVHGFHHGDSVFVAMAAITAGSGTGKPQRLVILPYHPQQFWHPNSLRQGLGMRYLYSNLTAGSTLSPVLAVSVPIYSAFQCGQLSHGRSMRPLKTVKLLRMRIQHW